MRATLQNRLFYFVLLFLITSPAFAVTIDSGDGSGNTSAPSNDPGWDNVGTREANALSVVYLGDRWVLTASHVGAGSVNLGGSSYEQALPLEHYLVGNGDGTNADLLLFRLRDLPPLPSLTLTTSALNAGPPATKATEVVMIGNGRDRPISKTYWDAAWNETTAPGTYAGYKTVSNKTMRWGTNRVSALNVDIDPICGVTDPSNTSCRPTNTFRLIFDSGLPTTDECRANSGDSGGAVFRESSPGQWELAGIMIAIDSYSGQPSTAYTVYGTSTYAADLWNYRDTIQAIIAAHPDTDNDGILDVHDNCPLIANPDQSDIDGDGIGDVCDMCQGNNASGDSDFDTLCDDIDLCPGVPNPNNNTDTNGDGIGDYCQCGDVNGDGITDNFDSLLIKRADLGLSTGSSYDPALCDVNGDNLCNNFDSLLVKRFDLGLSTGSSFRTICAPTP